MKAMKRIPKFIVSASFALILFCSVGAAQEFKSGFNNYSFSFDGTPVVREDTRIMVGRRLLIGELVVLQGENAALSIVVLNVFDSTDDRSLSQSKLSPAVKQEILRGIETEIRKNGRLFKKVPYSRGKDIGFELQSTDEPVRIERTYFSGDRVIGFSGVSRVADAKDSILNAMNSFRPLTKTERVIALIEENIPVGVPREKPKQWFHSDLEIRSLRGPVRIARETKLSAGSIEFLHESRFDEDGFATIEIGFNSGYPEVIAVWGWANGLRVDREVSVRYQFGDRPFHPSRFTVSGQTHFSTPEEAEASKIDLRYGTRYERTFDGKNRILTEVRRANNGALIFDRRYTYRERVVNMVAKAEDGAFFEHVRQTLDENGNVALLESLSETGSVLSTKRYTYKLDSQGNWIERMHFGKVGFGRRAVEKLIETVEREIVYYTRQGDRNIGQFIDLPDNRSTR
jgi:hypothetical protein